MTAEEVIKRLIEGNNRFVADQLMGRLQDSRRREKIAERQNPFAVVLGCADSRVVPELIFDMGLGELFVVRIAGNIASTSAMASIEYAVANLGINLVVVLGHQNCGAVQAALQGVTSSKNIRQLLSHIQLTLEALPENPQANEVTKMNAIRTTTALRKGSSIIRKAVENNELKIIAAYYNLDSGKVDLL